MSTEHSINSRIDKQLTVWHEDPIANRNLNLAICAGSATVGVSAAFITHGIMAPTITAHNKAVDDYNQSLVNLAIAKQSYADTVASNESIMTPPAISHELTFEHHANSFSTDATIGIYFALVTAIAAHQGIACRLKNKKQA